MLYSCVNLSETSKEQKNCNPLLSTFFKITDKAYILIQLNSTTTHETKSIDFTFLQGPYLTQLPDRTLAENSKTNQFRNKNVQHILEVINRREWFQGSIKRGNKGRTNGWSKENNGAIAATKTYASEARVI